MWSYSYFYHGDLFYKGYYVLKLRNYVFYIDKDYFSLIELESFAKDIGYDETEDFYTEDPITHRLAKLESGNRVHNFIKDFWSGSSFKLFLKYVTVNEGGPITSLR